MDAELSLSLPEELAGQAEALWQRFSQEAGTVDVERFLAWLHAQGHLNSEQLGQLLGRQEIEVTAFEETETFLRTIGLDMSRAGSAAGVRATTPLTPRSHYEMLSILGKGAMGMVHLAKDQDLQRKVAYKTMLSPENRAALARFVREAQITAQLDHPHIVPIYGMEVQPEGSLAYSMKLVQGKTFKELIAETRAFYDAGQVPDTEHSLPQLLDYFLKACDAMAYAHSKGVIHRDLKPANIMVGRYQEVYVMDWGIARVMHSDEMPASWVEIVAPEDDDSLDEKTRAGQILGTPRYMSPQQAAGKNDELDGRSDEFGLGLILYELLTLKPAFTATSQIDLLKKVLKAQKEPWQAYHPSRKIASELQAIVDKATRQKHVQRYAGVAELAADIRRYLRGEAPSARPDNSWRKLARWVGRHREVTLLALAAVVLFACGVVIWSLVQQQQALLQARQRESRLLEFNTRISHQGQHLDSYFQDMQALIQGLGSVTTHALTHPPAPEQLRSESLHINDAYALPPRKLFEAPDLLVSPYYTGEISPTWPIYVIAPGVDRVAIDPRLRQLGPLRHALKQVLMDSYTGGRRQIPDGEWTRLLANHGVPVLWSYVCLKEGVLYFYPGHDEPTKGYDVRIRPYYLQSKGKHGTVWGLPYDDPVGGMLIACSQGLFDAAGTFLGTVGIDIRLNYLRSHYLKLAGEPAVIEGFLLNDKGEILLRSHTDGKAGRRLGLKETASTPPYPVPAVLEAIRRRQPGGTMSEAAAGEDGIGRLIVYTRLNTLGWYYVVEANQTEVLEEASHKQ
ncbi:MAG: serine/threonine protein kinase [Candidatus Sericytochromatia bacterium]